MRDARAQVPSAVTAAGRPRTSAKLAASLYVGALSELIGTSSRAL